MFKQIWDQTLVTFTDDNQQQRQQSSDKKADRRKRKRYQPSLKTLFKDLSLSSKSNYNNNNNTGITDDNRKPVLHSLIDQKKRIIYNQLLTIDCRQVNTQLIVNSDVGIKTKFIITGKEVHKIWAIIQSPSGYRYDTNSQLYESVGNRIIVRVPNAEPGIWTIKFQAPEALFSKQIILPIEMRVTSHLRFMMTPMMSWSSSTLNSTMFWQNKDNYSKPNGLVKQTKKMDFNFSFTPEVLPESKSWLVFNNNENKRLMSVQLAINTDVIHNEIKINLLSFYDMIAKWITDNNWSKYNQLSAEDKKCILKTIKDCTQFIATDDHCKTYHQINEYQNQLTQVLHKLSVI